jgi:hypothetical protein
VLQAAGSTWTACRYEDAQAAPRPGSPLDAGAKYVEKLDWLATSHSDERKVLTPPSDRTRHNSRISVLLQVPIVDTGTATPESGQEDRQCGQPVDEEAGLQGEVFRRDGQA